MLRPWDGRCLRCGGLIPARLQFPFCGLVCAAAERHEAQKHLGGARAGPGGVPEMQAHMAGAAGAGQAPADLL
jgi:hypothetical protein